MGRKPQCEAGTLDSEIGLDDLLFFYSSLLVGLLNQAFFRLGQRYLGT